MLWLVKIWEVSLYYSFDSWSWQSFLSTCNVFLLSFSTGCITWNTAAINSLLLFMAGLFIEFFGWEMRRLSKLEIRFRMMSFSLFTLLDAGWKVPQAILALLDGFQELHLEWSNLSNYCICVCLFVFLYLISWSRAQFMRLIYARLY